MQPLKRLDFSFKSTIFNLLDIGSHGLVDEILWSYPFFLCYLFDLCENVRL